MDKKIIKSSQDLEQRIKLLEQKLENRNYRLQQAQSKYEDEDQESLASITSYQQDPDYLTQLSQKSLKDLKHNNHQRLNQKGQYNQRSQKMNYSNLHESIEKEQAEWNKFSQESFNPEVESFRKEGRESSSQYFQKYKQLMENEVQTQEEIYNLEKYINQVNIRAQYLADSEQEFIDYESKLSYQKQKVEQQVQQVQEILEDQEFQQTKLEKLEQKLERFQKNIQKSQEVLTSESHLFQNDRISFEELNQLMQEEKVEVPTLEIQEQFKKEVLQKQEIFRQDLDIEEDISKIIEEIYQVDNLKTQTLQQYDQKILSTKKQILQANQDIGKIRNSLECPLSQQKVNVLEDKQKNITQNKNKLEELQMTVEKYETERRLLKAKVADVEQKLNDLMKEEQKFIVKYEEDVHDLSDRFRNFELQKDLVQMRESNISYI